MNENNSKMNSTMGNFYNKEKEKFTIIKKIIELSSIKSNITKILLRLIKNGKNSLNKDQIKELNDYTKSIWEKERYEEIKKILDFENKEIDIDNFYSFDSFLFILKNLILSPVEKEFLEKIQKELEESDNLDEEIITLNNQIKQENKNKKNLNKTDVLQKQNPDKLLKEINNYENRMEKAHQKLNTTISQNKQLREKIDILRKEKNVIEDIYKKLKLELEKKKKSIENTILEAGRAHVNRDQAENDLNALQKNAENQKNEFEKECKELNENIEFDKKFKEFLKEKQKGKEQLEKLEKEIKYNQELIKQKKITNEAINTEYLHSEKKEKEIKEAFDRIKIQTGINKCEDLKNLYKNLHEQNTTMTVYVNELTKELEEIEEKIEKVKNDIKEYNTKGVTKDIEKHEMKIILSQKILEEEKKKEILNIQYDKSIETLKNIKNQLINVLESIGAENEAQELKKNAVTIENLMQYFGILEQKGIKLISEYSKLIAEQIKLEKGEQQEVIQHIDNLLNIVEYENKNLNDNLKNREDNFEFPDELFQKDNNNEEVKDDKFKKREELLELCSSEITKKKGSITNKSRNFNIKNK